MQNLTLSYQLCCYHPTLLVFLPEFLFYSQSDPSNVWHHIFLLLSAFQHVPTVSSLMWGKIQSLHQWPTRLPHLVLSNLCLHLLPASYSYISPFLYFAVVIAASLPILNTPTMLLLPQAFAFLFFHRYLIGSLFLYLFFCSLLMCALFGCPLPITKRHFLPSLFPNTLTLFYFSACHLFIW